MTDYTKLKVSELKELLKERDLPLSGTKSELVSRLEANDAANPPEEAASAATDAVNAAAPPEEAPAADEPAEAEPSQGEAAATEDIASDTKTEAEAETKAEAAPAADAAPAEPELTQAEAQQRVVEELELRIKRHKRFGTDATDTELRLKRIKQFGLSDVSEAKRLTAFKPDSRKRRAKSGDKKVSA